MDIEVLRVIWLVLIGVLWAGYLVLEGFDFGVGMLLPFLGRDDKERRLLINTIGPLWDGNEVWLLTAGGATFAAFPLWYSTLFSAFYLPLLLILVGLILRGVAFEYRGKIAGDDWARRWDLAIVVGSYLPSVLWGVAFGNIVHGVAQEDVVRGPFAVLVGALNPYSLLAGVAVTSLFLLHGALFLTLKTAGEMRGRALRTARLLAPVTTVAAGAWALWTQLAYSDKVWTWAVVVVAAAALVGVVVLTRTGAEAPAFALTCTVAVGAVVLIFGSIFPDVLPVVGGESLTIHNASSTQYTLSVMSVVALVFTPVVLAYQAWSIWVFRKRLGVHHIPAPAGLSPKPAPTPAA